MDKPPVQQLQRQRPLFRKSSYRPSSRLYETFPPQHLTQQSQAGVAAVQDTVSETQEPDLPAQQALQQSSAKASKQAFFKRKTGPFPLWVLLVVLAIACVTIAMASGMSRIVPYKDTALRKAAVQPTVTVQASSVTTPAANWITVQTFTGNGNKKTAAFSVGKNWRISWSCTPHSFYSGHYNLIATVTTSTNAPVDLDAIHTICESGHSSDTTQEYQGGTLYLNIYTEGSWKIQIQESK